MWEERGIPNICVQCVHAHEFIFSVHYVQLCDLMCICVDACASNIEYACHTDVGCGDVCSCNRCQATITGKMFHFVPVINHNHNPQRMTAGEELSQACNHVLEQKFKLKIVPIIIYPAFNLPYFDGVIWKGQQR